MARKVTCDHLDTLLHRRGRWQEVSSRVIVMMWKALIQAFDGFLEDFLED